MTTDMNGNTLKIGDKVQYISPPTQDWTGILYVICLEPANGIMLSKEKNDGFGLHELAELVVKLEDK